MISYDLEIINQEATLKTNNGNTQSEVGDI